MDQQPPRLDLALVGDAVHLDGDPAARLDRGHQRASSRLPGRSRARRRPRRRGGGSRPARGRRRAGRASRRARGRGLRGLEARVAARAAPRRPSPGAARRRRSRSRRAGRRRATTAAQTMHVPSRPIVTDGEAVAPAGRDRDLRQQLARADRGHVDAEEEVLRVDRRARRRRRRSSSRAPSATISGGRWFVGSFAQMLPPIVPRFRTWTSAICAQTSPRIGRARASALSTIVGVGRHRADLERRRRAPSSMPFSSSSAVQVDERVGRGDARLHHVDERLAAGERPRAVVLREQARAPRRPTTAVRIRLPAGACRRGSSETRARARLSAVASRPRCRASAARTASTSSSDVVGVRRDAQVAVPLGGDDPVLRERARRARARRSSGCRRARRAARARAA